MKSLISDNGQTVKGYAYIKGLEEYKENNHCAVRALATSLQITLEEADLITSKFGRQYQQGMNCGDVIDMVEANGFIQMDDLELINPNNSRKGTFTAESFIKAKVGCKYFNYYILVKGHAIGINHEGISDRVNFSGRKRIQRAFKIPVNKI